MRYNSSVLLETEVGPAIIKKKEAKSYNDVQIPQRVSPDAFLWLSRQNSIGDGIYSFLRDA